MRIVDTGQIDLTVIASKRYALIEEHPDAHLFERGHHVNTVVVAKYSIQRLFQPGSQFKYALEACIEWSICFSAIISRQYANVIFEVANNADEMLHRSLAYVSVQITEMKNCEICKCQRKALK